MNGDVDTFGTAPLSERVALATDWLREDFATEATSIDLIKWVVEHEVEHAGWEEYFGEFILTLSVKSIALIFQQSESPIEKHLWLGLLYVSLSNGIPIEFWPPMDDVERREICNRMGRAGDQGMLCAPAIMLQPPLTVGEQRIRPDAMAFVPAFPDNRLIIECDGFQFHGSREAFTADRKRDRSISDALGIEVRRYSGHELFHSFLEASVDLSKHIEKRFGKRGVNGI